MRYIVLPQTFVSIPIWCDYKDNFTTNPSSKTLFQFQYGAIISFRDGPISEFATQFQFQYGAIISLKCAILSCHRLSFQFQYGAIISVALVAKGLMVSGFNSNMVRL